MNRRFASILASAVTLALSGCGGGASSRSAGPSPSPQPSAAPVVAVGSASGRFVGSEACRSCHASEYDAWAKSRHRSTLRAATDSPAPRILGAKLQAPYSAAADGTITGPGTDGKPVKGRAAFVIGGHRREDLLVRLDDGRIQVFPVSFDVDRGDTFEPLREIGGGAPPADVVEFWTRVGRNADVACYGCHATGQTVEVAARSPSGLVLPASKWVEPGVGCEGCHGPGGPHIDAAKAGSPAKGPILLGASAKGAATDACAACHGLREVLPSPFSDAPAHRYGQSITVAAEPVLSMGSNAEFREPYFADLRPSTYQQEAIAFGQSGCARKGGMTCAACHDVHSGELRAGVLDEKPSSPCASCHAEIAAAALKHSGHAPGTPGGRCLDCHMAPMLRGPGHRPARDHSMAPPIAEPLHVPAACAACHGSAKDAAKVSAAWKQRVPSAASNRRAAIVAAVDQDNAGKAESSASLARLAASDDQGWFVRWASLQKVALGRSGPAPEPDLVPIRNALSDPNPAIRRAAARALGNRGRPVDAEALKRASDDPDPWAAIESAHALGVLGAPIAGARMLQLLSRPDLVADARAQYLYGHACLVGQDFPHAEQALRRALELNPIMVGAINDLGLALIGEGKKEPAIAAWNRALDLNPRFSAAKRNLEAARKSD